MKTFKNKLKGIVALFMTLVMLAGACLPAAAFSITHYDEQVSAEPCYSITYDDGKLKVQINGEIVYNILKDKIKNSTMVKKNVVEKTSDTSGTY